MKSVISDVNSTSLIKIDELNFSMLKQKLMDQREGEGWSYNKCEDVEWRYKMFLKLIYFYPNEQIVPDIEVDKFWHYHILDTKHYVSVTIGIFGRYIHHNPYLGLDSSGKGSELDVCFKKTQDLYYKHFGTRHYAKSACSNGGDDSGDSSTCSSRCSY